MPFKEFIETLAKFIKSHDGGNVLGEEAGTHLFQAVGVNRRIPGQKFNATQPSEKGPEDTSLVSRKGERPELE